MTRRPQISLSATVKLRFFALLAAVAVLSACATAKGVALRPFYTPAVLAPEVGTVILDIHYRTGEGADPDKHTLDLYRPKGSGWPVPVFFHGGSFEGGDKAKRLGPHDIYGNIGRFYAARGYGVAVVNYRLQPGVTWVDELDDVATAVSWVVHQSPSYGGGRTIFLSGHSIGGWMSARLTFDLEVQKRYGFDSGDFAGVISVSGSGFDLRDRETWRMNGQEDYWAERFDSGRPGEDWHEAASIVTVMSNDTKGIPPFLLIHSAREDKSVQRQNSIFEGILSAAGIPNELFKVRRPGHRRTVLAMSKPDKPLSEKILEFLKQARL